MTVVFVPVLSNKLLGSRSPGSMLHASQALHTPHFAKASFGFADSSSRGGTPISGYRARYPKGAPRRTLSVRRSDCAGKIICRSDEDFPHDQRKTGRGVSYGRVSRHKSCSFPCWITDTSLMFQPTSRCVPRNYFSNFTVDNIQPPCNNLSTSNKLPPSQFLNTSTLSRMKRTGGGVPFE
jgi:hypothetical protein